MFALIRLLGHTKVLKVVGRLLLDRRVPVRLKLIVPVALIYLVSPIDPFPDLIPFLGHIDDLVVVAVSIGLLLVMAPRDVVLEKFRDPPSPAEDEPAIIVEGEYRHADRERDSQS